jgi:4-diphosphocytidyl-2-C-methyl-D-erythritol kinase
MAQLTVCAPAKLNLTLEVIGTRADGFHELSSVVTTLSLCDEIVVGSGRGFVMLADEEYDASALPDGRGIWNSAELALALITAHRFGLACRSDAELTEALRKGLGEVHLELRKRIPASAGLGGGSSDGAVTLLALNEFWELDLNTEQLSTLALRIGSDCPLFLVGGTVLMTGRGETCQQLPAPSPFWLCLLSPPVVLERKTALLYRLLGPRQFSQGGGSVALAHRLQRDSPCEIRTDDLSNVFDAVADQAFGDLEVYRCALRRSGALTVHVCGSGPTLYGLYGSETAARSAADALRAEGFAVAAVSNLVA